jgi:hypothetical protein
VASAYRRLTLALLSLTIVACSPTTTALPSAPASLVSATPRPIDAACTPDPDAPVGLGDPCPTAITAAELAAAPVRLPIARVVIEPGPFFCDDVWPGVGSEIPCYAPAVQPGQFMHAWVSFTGSQQVAAVMLGRDLPAERSSPRSTAPPWTATLVNVEVPPAEWVMP